MHKKYKHMVNRMQETCRKGEVDAAPWYVYILRCSDASYYTGITNDLERRLTAHNKGQASRYTRVRLPVERVYEELCGTRAEALKREMTIKTYSRDKKEQLVTTSHAVNRKS